jgi:hypothetical protein
MAASQAPKLTAMLATPSSNCHQSDTDDISNSKIGS